MAAASTRPRRTGPRSRRTGCKAKVSLSKPKSTRAKSKTTLSHTGRLHIRRHGVTTGLYGL